MRVLTQGSVRVNAAEVAHDFGACVLCGPAGGAHLAADKPRFSVHVAGPDDVRHFRDELDAHRYANAVNATYLADRLKNPDDEVLCVATVHAVPDNVAIKLLP